VFKQSGYSLIEILIASMLGLLLSAAVLSILFSTYRSYKLNTAIEEVQENGALALFFIKTDLSALGFSSCFEKGLNNANILSLGVIGEHLYAHREIVGNLYTYKESDSITFVTTLSKSSELLHNMHTVHSSVDVLNERLFKQQQELFITDCNKAELFSVSDVWQEQLSHDRSYNKDSNFSHAYIKGSMITPLSLVSYKIAKGVGGLPGLYRKIGSRTHELVPHVHLLKVLYGIRASKKASIAYLKASQVLNYEDVVSVHLSLLFSSAKEVMSKKMLIEGFSKKPELADDLRYYKRFELQVILHNKVID
jgi:type IV pilus assembly protein PilW